MELRAVWETLECRNGGWPRTTVLVLDRNFAGHLPSLIQRQRPESRLIIAAADGSLLQLAIGELADENGGWTEIWCADDWRHAVDEARRSLRSDEELALFWPAWHDQNPVPCQPHRRGASVDTIGKSAAFAHRGSINSLRGSVA
ncbi:MAG: hypothetical protein C0485_11130 [Pirellula sp.]|nr:hypothetical protein [Pirellula sp.]